MFLKTATTGHAFMEALLTERGCRFPSAAESRAVRHLRSSGVDVPDQLLAHVASLGWEHIGLTGNYLWSEMDKPRERFRPLRLHQTGRDA